MEMACYQCTLRVSNKHWAMRCSVCVWLVSDYMFRILTIQIALVCVGSPLPRGSFFIFFCMKLTRYPLPLMKEMLGVLHCWQDHKPQHHNAIIVGGAWE